MTYDEWFEQHSDKHKKIVDKLLAKGFSDDEIIEYFDFENMVKEENNFCPLYKDNKKCHNMEKLNCYFCGCPHFRFNDNGLGEYNEFKILSKCDINNGEKFADKGIIHQNCSKCSVPHYQSFVKKNFDLDWKKIMKECKIDF